jgi:phage-related holin
MRKLLPLIWENHQSLISGNANIILLALINLLVLPFSRHLLKNLMLFNLSALSAKMLITRLVITLALFDVTEGVSYLTMTSKLIYFPLVQSLKPAVPMPISRMV